MYSRVWIHVKGPMKKRHWEIELARIQCPKVNIRQSFSIKETLVVPGKSQALILNHFLKNQ